jgi:hypothetical protein
MQTPEGRSVIAIERVRLHPLAWLWIIVSSIGWVLAAYIVANGIVDAEPGKDHQVQMVLGVSMLTFAFLFPAVGLVLLVWGCFGRYEFSVSEPRSADAEVRLCRVIGGRHRIRDARIGALAKLRAEAVPSSGGSASLIYSAGGREAAIFFTYLSDAGAKRLEESLNLAAAAVSGISESASE